MKRLLNLALSFLLFAAPAQAATYYLDLDAGSNGSGTIGSPYNVCSSVTGTNALTANDILYIKKGTKAEGSEAVCHFKSTGSAGNYITVDAYSSGANPQFWGNSVYTGGWTQFSGSIWMSDASITWAAVGAVSVDDATALSGGCTSGCNANMDTTGEMEARTFLFNATQDRVYVWLSDGSDPNGHSIRISRYGVGSDSANYGLFQFGGTGASPAGSSYIKINNIDAYLANESSFNAGVGFGAAGAYHEFSGCTSSFNSREGFHFRKNGEPAPGGEHGKLTNCTATYNNGKRSGFGQGITTEAPYVNMTDVESSRNEMAGFDWLDFNANTDASYGTCVRCVAEDTSQAANQTFSDPGIYCDACSNTTFVGGVTSGTGEDGNFPDGASVNAENPAATGPPANVNFVNHLSFNNAGKAFSAVVSTSGYNMSGIGLYNSTLAQGPSPSFALVTIQDYVGGSFNHYNNIEVMRSTGGSTPYRFLSSLDAPYINSDYNIFYRPDGGTTLFDVSSSNYTLATWRTLLGGTSSGDESHSLQTNPLLVDATTETVNARLQSTSEGYGADSPGINFADTTKWVPPAYAPWTVIEGTTRIDEAIDSGANDVGHHYFVSDPPDPAPPLDLSATNVEPGSLVRSTVSTVTISFTTQSAIPATGKIIVVFPTSLGSGYVLNSGGTGVAGGLSGLDGTLTVGVVGATATFTRGGGATSSAAGAKSFTYTFVKNPDVAGSTGPYTIQTTDTNSLVLDEDDAVTADTITDPPASTVPSSLGGCKLAGGRMN